MESKNRVISICLAAGNGNRFGGEVPKAFFKIDSYSILEKSIEALNLVSDEVICVVPDGFQDKVKIKNITVGGKTRYLSVKNGLLFYTKNLNPNPKDLILIHDCARCFVTNLLLKKIVNEGLKHGSAIPVLKSVDTVILKDGEKIQYLDRSKLYRVQTPQAFLWRYLEVSHFAENCSEDALDDASLVINAGFRVNLIEGEEENRKVTVRGDV